ncbi:hypothetical protein EYF80_023997 [Liparis tanakae]|uniref:Uncharacterized protein n=1 Tax=Liparis tanakae TaxID=230148 RepID=A0A4Z2HKL8_9TELE|nr:hypothetical protein EYF80_023997 [Liparis tanakae]
MVSEQVRKSFRLMLMAPRSCVVKLMLPVTRSMFCSDSSSRTSRWSNLLDVRLSKSLCSSKISLRNGDEASLLGLGEVEAADAEQRLVLKFHLLLDFSLQPGCVLLQAPNHAAIRLQGAIYRVQVGCVAFQQSLNGALAVLNPPVIKSASDSSSFPFACAARHGQI